MNSTDIAYSLRNVLLIIIPLLAGAPAASADDHSKVVNGVAIYLGVVPSELITGHPKAHTERKMHGGVPRGQHRHHVMVALFDSVSGRRIKNAVVRATVAEIGLSGRAKKLEPMIIADTVSYGNYFLMNMMGPYRIHLRIRIPKRPDVIKIYFDFRHALP